MEIIFREYQLFFTAGFGYSTFVYKQKKASAVHRYFTEKEHGQYVCTICDRPVASKGGTGHMWSHLQTRHSDLAQYLHRFKRPSTR